VAGWIDGETDKYIRPKAISNLSYALGNYRDHVEWFAVRVEQRDTVGWFNDFLHWNPDYWERLREWSLADPGKVRDRLELIDRHRSVVDEATVKLVL
jgi:hypothetical protein